MSVSATRPLVRGERLITPPVALIHSRIDEPMDEINMVHVGFLPGDPAHDAFLARLEDFRRRYAAAAGKPREEVKLPVWPYEDDIRAMRRPEFAGLTRLRCRSKHIPPILAGSDNRRLPPSDLRPGDRVKVAVGLAGWEVVPGVHVVAVYLNAIYVLQEAHA